SNEPPPQLLSVASLLTLEARYREAGLEVAAAGDERALEAPWLSHTSAWLHEAGTAIALATNSAACLLDLDGVIIDGNLARPLLAALLREVDTALSRYSWEGVVRPELMAGTIGSDA